MDNGEDRIVIDKEEFNDSMTLCEAIKRVYDLCIFVNLTKNTYHMIEYERFIAKKASEKGEFDELIELGAESIPDIDESRAFKHIFSRKALIADFKMGKKTVAFQHKQIGDDGVIHWMETKVIFVKMVDGDICEITFAKNIDRDRNHLEHFRTLLFKESIYKEAINSDASAYFEINLSRDIITSNIVSYTEDTHEANVIEPDLGDPVPYMEFMRWLSDNVFNGTVKEYLSNTDREFLIANFLSGKKMYEFVFWVYEKNKQPHCRKQIYFMSRDEKCGDIIALCILKDMNDTQRKEAELKRNQDIISFFSTEYTTIIYLDMKDKTIIPYRMTPEAESIFKSCDLNRIKYDQLLEYYVNTIVVDEDKEDLIRYASLDNMKEQLFKKNDYSVIYRSQSNGLPRFFELKVVKVGSDGYPNAAILGFSDKDDEFKRKRERRSHINKSNEIIRILANEYTIVLYVDLNEDSFTPYNLGGNYSNIFGEYINKKKRTFSDLRKYYIENKIIEEDRNMVMEYSETDYIKKQLSRHKSYVVNYHAFNDVNEQKYCQMRVIRVGNKKTIDAIVLGFADKTEELRRQNEYNEKLREAREKAESASKAKSTFLFNMSHDIRTPMNAILGFTAMAKKYINDPEKMEECLDKVELSGNHLLSLINDVLDMARIENNKIIIEETPNNIRYNFEQFIEIMQPNAKERDLELTLEIKNLTDEEIYFDALRMNRVIMNIVSNSLKYTKPGGSINVTLEQKPSDREGYGAYDMIFSDTGIGMSKQFLDTIFDLFTREKNTTVSGIQGTGLGMAITKNFVELMGGTIDIDSALGLGTTVTCHMYFRIQNEKAKTEEVPVSEEDIDFSNVRLLLVEDNELNREIAKDVLEEMGVTVEEASDGSVAVDMVSLKEPGYYDLIFMDIQMPYMDGYKATRAIRDLKDPVAASVPIVAMTANAFEEDKKKALESGMNGHLAKPLDIGEIVKMLIKYGKKDDRE